MQFSTQFVVFYKMSIPPSIIVNADDIGLNSSVNNAILYSFEQGYINSTSLLTNMDCFNETIDLIQSNPAITSIGLHGNFAEGKPITNFKYKKFLDAEGNWDLERTGKLTQLLNKEIQTAFAAELTAQIEKAISGKINITHLDSHLHQHTLPSFYNIYIDLAKRYKLQLRLAQTYREGSYPKFWYRKFLNNKIKSNHIARSDFFETVDKFLSFGGKHPAGKTELMVHPCFDEAGELFDHVDGVSMEKLVAYLKAQNSPKRETIPHFVIG